MDVYGQLQSRIPRVDYEENLAAIRRLWGAKLLVHAKDYAQGVKIMGGVRVDKRNSGNLCSNARIAYAWFTNTSTSPGSFIWVCEVFGLDPDRIRMQVFHNWRGLLTKANPRMPKKLIDRLYAMGDDDDDDDDDESSEDETD